MRYQRPGGIAKIGNGYATAVNAMPGDPAKVRDLYNAIPKAVWAAIAVSFGTRGGDLLDEAREIVLREWWVLYQNGIVPQKPCCAEPSPEETS